MRKLLLAALAALTGLAFAAPSFAAMNIRQNSDGTADWVGSQPDDPFFSNCVGGVVMQKDVTVGPFVTTGIFISPITNAVLRNAAVAMPITGSSTNQVRFQFYVGGQGALRNTTFPVVYRATQGTTSNVATPADITLDLSIAASSRGRVFSISTPLQAGPAVSVPRLASNTVMRGDSIFVQSTNPGAFNVNLVTAPVMLHFCPR